MNGLIGTFATDWIRYSDYVIKEKAPGKNYLVPGEDASFTMYNPFDVAEEMLTHLMGIGTKALEGQDVTGEVVVFAKKYGLLGLISASCYNRNILGDEVLMLMENNFVTRDREMKIQEYVDLFTPFAREEDLEIKKHTNKLKKVTVELRKADDSPKFYGKRPVVMDLIFSRFYGEQLDWIINFSKMLVSHFKQVKVFRTSSTYLTQEVTILAGKFQAEKIGFTINQLDKTTIAWQFDSLKTAIETIYAFAVTEESNVLKECDHCKKIFIGKNRREKYCTPACRNRANVQKSRSRQED